MDSDLVRTLVHASLRRMLIRVQTDHSYEGQYNVDMQLGHVSSDVERLGRQNGHIAATDHLSKEESRFVVETLWELIIHGMLTPTSESGSGGWPLISLTDYGKLAILQEEYTPYDPTGYFERLKKSCPDLDSIIAFYLKEALGCFRAGRHPACAVMLGVASERLFDILFDSFLQSLTSDKNPLQRTQGQMINRRYDAFKRRVDSIKGQLPPAIRDRLEINLVSIFNLIRYTRNDAGHPTQIVVERDESFANLQVFGRYCEYTYTLINYFEDNPASL